VRIRSVNTGRPQIMVRGERRISSAINRKPRFGAVLLTNAGFEADSVSDQSVHGGPDKAACCYPFEHYAYFAALLARELAIPSFGENLTTEGLFETQVCIGDIFRIGSAIVQVTQPRSPCTKLAMKNNEPRLPEWVLQSGFTGWYFRVLEAGTIVAGDECELLVRPHASLTVAHVKEHALSASGDTDALREIAAAPELSEFLRGRINSKLVEL
jgi:MOSC domain-containing protein YiiM